MKSWKRLTAAALAVAVAMSGLGITGNVWKGKLAHGDDGYPSYAMEEH